MRRRHDQRPIHPGQYLAISKRRSRLKYEHFGDEGRRDTGDPICVLHNHQTAGPPGFNPHQGYGTTAASLGYKIVTENLAYITIDPAYVVYAAWQDALSHSRVTVEYHEHTSWPTAHLTWAAAVILFLYYDRQ